VILISGHATIETAVKGTKLGAFDFIEKPFSLDGLLRIVTRALDHHASQRLQRDGHGSGGLSVAGLGDGAQAVMPAATARERTLRRSVVASGHGLHSGIKTGLILQPLPPRSGIVFANLSADDTVPALVDFVESTGYATTLHRNGVVAKTVEHLLATLHAYRVSNLLVKVQGEVPTMDGSAVEFCKLIENAGVEEQAAPAEEIVIRERLVVGRDDGSGEMIAVEPADEFSIDYTLRYPAPVGEQQLRWVYRGPESFRDEIAPARTFGFLRDMKAMAAMGLASGGRLDNCILVDDDRVVNTTLRFADEFVRHKILDVMGDLYLLGRPIRGAVTARLTGHSDNIALVKLIRQSLARA
jgi:UDP-3-O-acyl N-acetylglucosamine deacetylase